MWNFKELLVWQKSVEFVTEIYAVTDGFPQKEMFGRSSELRRASVSVPSNMAEGNSRRGTSDYLQFLKIARGSCAEIETQLIISKNLNFIHEKKFEVLTDKLTEILKMLNGLINSLVPKS